MGNVISLDEINNYGLYDQVYLALAFENEVPSLNMICKSCTLPLEQIAETGRFTCAGCGYNCPQVAVIKFLERGRISLGTVLKMMQPKKWWLAWLK